MNRVCKEALLADQAIKRYTAVAKLVKNHYYRLGDLLYNETGCKGTPRCRLWSSKMQSVCQRDGETTHEQAERGERMLVFLLFRVLQAQVSILAGFDPASRSHRCMHTHALCVSSVFVCVCV